MKKHWKLIGLVFLTVITIMVEMLEPGAIADAVARLIPTFLNILFIGVMFWILFKGFGKMLKGLFK